jgi:hypothetical protein
MAANVKPEEQDGLERRIAQLTMEEASLARRPQGGVRRPEEGRGLQAPCAKP